LQKSCKNLDRVFDKTYNANARVLQSGADKQHTDNEPVAKAELLGSSFGPRWSRIAMVVDPLIGDLLCRIFKGNLNAAEFLASETNE
jgi:hypothetical protein